MGWWVVDDEDGGYPTDADYDDDAAMLIPKQIQRARGAAGMATEGHHEAEGERQMTGAVGALDGGAHAWR